MKNKIIVIGGSHLNTLGVIRIFGKNGISPYLFLIGESDDYIIKSKYINSFTLCDNESTAVSKCLELFKNEDIKPVVIPTSDKASSCLDSRFDELSQYFILPTINHMENAINCYMDKYQQYQLFSDCGLPCLKTWKVQLNFLPDVSFDMTSPCIIKPHISAKGDKADITVCQTSSEYENALSSLKQKGYHELLVQDYLTYDTEYDIAGFVYNDQVCISGMIKKIHTGPKNRGSTSFGEVCPIKNEIAQMIEKLLLSIHFDGVFDIEVFEKDKTFYINEINFRNSAVASAYSDSHPAYFWYLSHSLGHLQIPSAITKTYLFINENAELSQVLAGKISILTYLGEKRKSKVRLVKNKQDPLPSRALFRRKIKRLFKRIIK